MNLRNLRIGARLGTGFGIILAMLLLVIVAVNVISEKNREKSTAGLQTAHTKEILANAMKSALLEGGVAMRNIGLQTDVGAMQKEEAQVKVQRKNYAEARDKLTAIGLNDAEKNVLSAIASLDKQMDAPFVDALGKALAFDNEGAAKTIAADIDPPSRKAVLEINKLVDLQHAETRAMFVSTEVAGKDLRNLLFLIGAVALAIGAGCALLITRSITQPLRGAVSIARTVADGNLSSQIAVTGKDETSELLQSLKNMNDSLLKIVGDVRHGTDAIATASSQIAAGNLDLSSRTEQQASSLEETASSMEELTSTVKQNADNARQANQLAASASEVALKAGAVVSQVVDTMGSIHASSRKIVDIISVIDGIAFQTNILALNAAVEAARAGEQGRGFAVVATEVRNLAQRSAAAAKEIKALISDSDEQVGNGSKLVEQAGATMEEVVASVRRVTDIMGEIAAASHEQSAGIEQVNQAMTQMDQVTQQNAALVEQAAAAAESMQDQAAELAQVVSVFKLDETQAAAAVLPAGEIHAAPRTKAAALHFTRKISSARMVADHSVPVKKIANGAPIVDNKWEDKPLAFPIQAGAAF
jgi:methyl-accepting chemotaxis protein